MPFLTCLRVWGMQIMHGDIFNLFDPREVRIWHESRHGVAWIQCMPNGMFTIDAYATGGRKPLRAKLKIARDLMDAFKTQYPGKNLHCIFHRSRYKILILMRHLEFEFVGIINDQYVFRRP